MTGLLAALAVAASVLLVGPGAIASEHAPSPDLEHLLDRIRSEPRQADNFAALAAWLYRQGDLPRARAAAAEAVRLEPDESAHLRLLGFVATADGAEAEALAALRQAAELDPSARASLADFHLARAWAGYQDALRRAGPEPSLLLRLREIAAAAEITPELKALVRGGWPDEVTSTPERVPPLFLGDGVDTAVVVEKRTQTARLYARGPAGVVLLKTYPCTTGQAEGAKQERGDLKTPDGVYFVSDLLPGQRLPREYGALALPLSYPNAWDRRAGRSGHGIWLHGTDRLGSPFTPRDTRGCVILRNDDLIELAAWIEPQVTPILIAEEIPDRPLAEWQVETQKLLRAAGEERPAAIAISPEYAMLLHRDGATARQTYVPPGDSPAAVHDEVVLETAGSWDEKLREVRPEHAAVLLRVALPAGENRVVIETSAPVRARLFRAEIGRRVYVDLLGVRSVPLPESVEGSGAVTRVRISTVAVDPPLTRLVLELKADVTPRLEAQGARIVVSLDGGAPSAPRTGSERVARGR